MKRNLKIQSKNLKSILASFFLLCFFLPSFAQGPRYIERGLNKGENNKKQELIEAKLNEIKKELNLSEKQFKSLSAIYMKKEREKEFIHQDHKGSRHLDKTTILELSPQEAQAKINQDYEAGKRMLELHKNYQEEFAKILNPNQILLMENCERSCMRKMREEYKTRKK